MINYSGASGGYILTLKLVGIIQIYYYQQSVETESNAYSSLYWWNDDVYKINNGVIYLLDSPGTTNALTYKLQGRTP